MRALRRYFLPETGLIARATIEIGATSGFSAMLKLFPLLHGMLLTSPRVGTPY